MIRPQQLRPAQTTTTTIVPSQITEMLDSIMPLIMMMMMMMMIMPMMKSMGEAFKT